MGQGDVLWCSHDHAKGLGIFSEMSLDCYRHSCMNLQGTVFSAQELFAHEVHEDCTLPIV